MGRGKRFTVATAVAVVAAAVTTTAVYAVTRGGGDGAATPSVSSIAPLAKGKFDANVNGCKMGQADLVVNDAYGQSTTSTSYVAVPGMSTVVKVKAKFGCLVAQVSADGFNGTGDLEYVTVAVDGFTGGPTEVQFAGDDQGTFAEAHAAQFVFPVTKGFHTVTMYFKSFGGDIVYLGYPTMVITHP